MSFRCGNCNETVNGPKMAGIVIGQISRELLEAKGLSPSPAALTGQLSSGILSGFRIECPKCKSTNWR